MSLANRAGGATAGSFRFLPNTWPHWPYFCLELCKHDLERLDSVELSVLIAVDSTLVSEAELRRAHQVADADIVIPVPCMARRPCFKCLYGPTRTTLQLIYVSGQILIFHQPGFSWNKGISLTKPPFGVRSCEVAIIWPDVYTIIFWQTPGTYPWTPNQQFMKEVVEFGGFGDIWGMLQGAL